MSSLSDADERDGMVEVDGARLHYTRAGTGRGPLVLLHGLTDDGACWTAWPPNCRRLRPHHP